MPIRLNRISDGEQTRRKRKLKSLYRKKGITRCELNLPPISGHPEKCWENNGLTFAHKEKRLYYKNKPEDLWTFKETVLACISCHAKIEQDRDLTLQIFKKLRNN